LIGRHAANKRHQTNQPYPLVHGDAPLSASCTPLGPQPDIDEASNRRSSTGLGSAFCATHQRRRVPAAARSGASKRLIYCAPQRGYDKGAFA
jgi:hypothetical protein